MTRGRNDFALTSTDPTSGKQSPSVNVIVNVAVPATPTPIATASPTPVPTSSAGLPIPVAQLSITQPADGAQVASGAVAVTGTTNATGVTITASYVGPAGVGAPSPAPPAAASPTPGGAPAPGIPAAAPAPPAPPAVHVAATSGAFSGSTALTPGRWAIGVATDQSDTLASATRSVTVDVASAGGFVVIVTARGAPAWISAWTDGNLVEKGRVFRNGDSATYTAKNQVVVHTGNAGATDFIVDGRDLGTLGGDGAVQTWQFDKGKPPHRQ